MPTIFTVLLFLLSATFLQSSTSLGLCTSGSIASLLTPASITPIQQLIKLMPLNHSYSTAMATATAAATAEPIFEDVSTLPPITLAEHTLQGQFRDVEVPLYDINKEPIGKFILDGDIFDVPIRRDILHRVVRWQLARRQQGTHKTKTRSEVRGGGRKPWNQKGSGRARQGTIRAPQWRGGGVVHGPVPRTHEHDLQKRVRRLGLKCALSAKAWERRVIVVDSLRPGDFKTKTMDGHVERLLQGAVRRSVLMVDSDKDGLDGG